MVNHKSKQFNGHSLGIHSLLRHNNRKYDIFINERQQCLLNRKIYVWQNPTKTHTAELCVDVDVVPRPFFLCEIQKVQIRKHRFKTNSSSIIAAQITVYSTVATQIKTPLKSPSNHSHKKKTTTTNDTEWRFGSMQKHRIQTLSFE